MQSSKLIQLLGVISAEEMHWLAKFVHSPYFNSNQGVIKLFEYVRKYHPDFTSSKLNRTTVFSHIFPNTVFNDRRLRVLMFRLSELVTEFLVTEHLKVDRFQHQKHLLDELQDRKLYDWARKQASSLQKELEAEPFRDIRYYEEKWRLQHRQLFSSYSSKSRNIQQELQDMLHKMDGFYMLSKLRYASELLNRQNILAEQHEIPLLEEISLLVRQHPSFADKEVFQIYTDVLLLMKEPLNEDVFARLNDNFNRHLHVFQPENQSSILRYLINSSIQLYHNGRLSYLSTQFKLYRIGLSKELFLVEGQLPEATFLNISITATLLREIKWVSNFILTYQEKIPEQSRKDASFLAHAYLLFAQKRFLDSHSKLQQVSISNQRYMLRVKSLSLRNYFELYMQDASYDEIFLSESRSFEKFIRRNTHISARRSSAYLNFIIILRKIGKFLPDAIQVDKKILQQLHYEITHKQALIARKWLIEKVEQL